MASAFNEVPGLIRVSRREKEAMREPVRCAKEGQNM